MESRVSLIELNDFIVRAKSVSYVGGGTQTTPCRTGSHDLKFQEGEFAYLDSYFGGTDFIGQEVVYYREEPVWAMNYYGKILVPGKISGAETGKIIKASLSMMYAEGRFLGGFNHAVDGDVYNDQSDGDVESFTGREWISRKGEKVYELVYHGGLIIP